MYLSSKLISEWHPKNSMGPKKIKSKSRLKVWWLCQKNSCEHKHEWEARIYSRTLGRGCPFCAGQKICPCNSVAGKNPELAKEWHPTKNKFKPEEIALYSRKVAVWRCSRKGCGREWKDKISKRAQGSLGCPTCKGRYSHGEKNVEAKLERKGIIFSSQKKISYQGSNMFLDFYLPDYNVAIEFDGIQHFKPISYFGGKIKFQRQQLLDQYKNFYCTENKIPLLRIHYLDMIEFEQLLDFLVTPCSFTYLLFSGSYEK